MKKKESLKQLLERLDKQSATYNTHLEKANDLFDAAMKKMEWLLSHERKDLQASRRIIKKLSDLLQKTASYANGKTKSTKKK